MPPYTNFLTLSHQHKPIPYGGSGQVREDGDANYGFKYVKGNEALLLEIPELKSDSALRALVQAINASHTGLFSVGCVSGEIEDERGFRHSGYVEFSINSVSMIADARSYFSFFFHFDRLLNENAFQEAVSFNWELQPATFTEADALGFTCTVFINTHYSNSKSQAEQVWFQALEVLGQFLSSIPPEHQDYIYQQ